MYSFAYLVLFCFISDDRPARRRFEERARYSPDRRWGRRRSWSRSPRRNRSPLDSRGGGRLRSRSPRVRSSRSPRGRTSRSPLRYRPLRSRTRSRSPRPRSWSRPGSGGGRPRSRSLSLSESLGGIFFFFSPLLKMVFLHFYFLTLFCIICFTSAHTIFLATVSFHVPFAHSRDCQSLRILITNMK